MQPNVNSILHNVGVDVWKPVLLLVGMLQRQTEWFELTSGHI